MAENIIMGSEDEQERYRLEQLVQCVQQNTNRIRSQLDELTCRVSDDVSSIKLLPQNELLQQCSEVESSLQQVLTLQKSIDLLMNEYTLSGNLESKSDCSFVALSESESNNNFVAPSASKSDSSFVIPSNVLPYVDLPVFQIPLDGLPQAVMLSHVNSPSHFYMHLINSETTTLDMFHEAMVQKYKDDDEPLNVTELQVGSCWAAHWTDGIWYRARVIANVLTSGKSIPERNPKVRVHFVDFGDCGIVSIKDIRLLHEDFTVLPCLAVPGCLAQVFHESGLQESLWSTRSTEAFVNLCGGFQSILFAYLQQDNLSGVYNVIMKRPDGIVVNKEIVVQGFASSKFFSQHLNHCEHIQNSKVVENSRDPPEEIPEGWDPMSSAFQSHENTLFHNDECAEYVLTGMKNTDETRLCKFYRQGKKCPRADACPWVHERQRDGITVEKKEVVHDYWEHNPLPCEGSLLAAIVTSVTTPAQFHIFLPYGRNCLKKTLDAEDRRPTEYEMLSSSMQNYYKNSPPKSHMHLPAPGELRVLCELKDGKLDCSRVRVIEVQEEDITSQVKVFFIDIGIVEWVKEDQLHPLAVQFVHTAPQAVECWLTEVEMPVGGWLPVTAKHLKELTEAHTLIAQVDYVDGDHDRLGVTLHNTDEDQDININEMLLSKLESKSD